MLADDGYSPLPPLRRNRHDVVMLDAIGIRPEAEGVYEALLGGQPAAFDGLMSATGLPRQRLRVALRTLEAHGLISRVSGSPTRYVVTDPGIALDVLLLEREQQIKRARVRAQELAERHHQAAAGRNPAELVEVVTGRQAVTQRVDQAQRSARREIRGFDKPPYAAPIDSTVDSQLEFVRGGGVLRAIHECAALEEPGYLARLEPGVAAGEQARVLPWLPMKLFLVDDRLAIVPLQAAPAAIESSVVVHQSALLEALSALFETLWQLALPLELAAADPSLLDNPSAEERLILASLTAGLPDEAIARQLGISDRTYQRRIHDLMERLHVQTRFQLARQAARRGWLDADIAAPGKGLNASHQ